MTARGPSPYVAASSTVRGGARELPRLTRAAGRMMRALGLHGRELSLCLVSDEAIATLNRLWRKKNKPTDVLSFPQEHPVLLGDVVISLETAKRAASVHRVGLRRELDLYLAHGLLHLLGHDHHRKADRQRMAALEARLLGQAGMLTR